MRRLMACWGIALIAAAAFPLTTSGQRPLDAGEVTFTKHVAPIVYAECAYCHRPGEVAPFSLLTYKDARPWARSIKQAVVKKAMPPWRADAHFGEFRNARTLTDQEIQTISAWVDGGAKEGNPADLPPQPTFAEGWQIDVGTRSNCIHADSRTFRLPTIAPRLNIVTFVISSHAHAGGIDERTIDLHRSLAVAARVLGARHGRSARCDAASFSRDSAEWAK